MSNAVQRYAGASEESAFEKAIANGETGSGNRSLMSEEPKNAPIICGSESTNVSPPQMMNKMS